MNDLRSGVCFLLRRGSNTASSYLKARDKQPQVRLFTSIYDFTRMAIGLNKQLSNSRDECGVGSVARDNVQVEGVELIRCVNGLTTGPAYAMNSAHAHP